VQITPTTIPDVLIIEPKVFGDERGFFFESFNQAKFEAATAVAWAGYAWFQKTRKGFADVL